MSKTVNLALQGGGAHGAFIWGVLNRFLEDERLTIEGISATSAGAMNAVVFAYGFALDGRDGAKRKLHEFWFQISQTSPGSQIKEFYEQWMKWSTMSLSTVLPFNPTLFPQVLPQPQAIRDALTEAGLLSFDMMSRILSPYQYNPFNHNPLHTVLNEAVDFSVLQEKSPVKLFLCATNVSSGKIKIFKNKEITAEAVLASACLPFLFQSVIIDGQPYWDGGYMGNPAIYPLIYNCQSPDVVILHINPIERKEIPQTASEILDRLNEITFNSSLMREMRAIFFVTKMIDEGKISGQDMKRLLIHGISAFDEMSSLGVLSKLDPDWGFLQKLRDTGYAKADEWLGLNYDKIGVESTIDIADLYL